MINSKQKKTQKRKKLSDAEYEANFEFWRNAFVKCQVPISKIPEKPKQQKKEEIKQEIKEEMKKEITSEDEAPVKLNAYSD